MEELFQYMKALRSQINDVADQAAKMSVEEHVQCTTIQTLQKDLDLVKNETKQVKEETDNMTKVKGQICLHIMEKQRKIASLESEIYTLCQTLELMQQERLSLSAKLVDRSAYYEKVAEDINGQLNEQQEWLDAQNFGSQTRESLALVNQYRGTMQVREKARGTEEFQDDMNQSMMMDLQAAQAKFDKMEQLMSSLVLEDAKLSQTLEIVKTKMTDFRPELREMDEKRLEEELQAILSDKAGEAEYVQSLQHQIMRLKEISHTVRCTCGEEYNVKLDI